MLIMNIYGIMVNLVTIDINYNFLSFKFIILKLKFKLLLHSNNKINNPF